MAPRFRFETVAAGADVVRITLSGELDAEDAPVIDDFLCSAQSVAVLTILDIRRLSAIGPTLLNVVTAADVRAREQGRRLVILLGPESRDPRFEALGLDARLMTIDEPPPAPDTEPPAGDASGPFALVSDVRQDCAVITVRGEVDLATAPELAAALAQQAQERHSVVLDLRGVRFMDCTGIHLLLRAGARSRDDGLAFRLITSEPVDHTLEVLGLTARFEYVDSLQRDFDG